jgi:hypothetical protein
MGTANLACRAAGLGETFLFPVALVMRVSRDSVAE